MNEWGFIGQDILVGIGMSATSFKFKSRRGFEELERLVLSDLPTHHTWTLWGINRMNLKFYLILFLLSLSSALFGQVNEQDMYESAYNYLNDSIVKPNYGDAKSLRRDCKQTVKGARLRFEDELQVANKFIQNDWGFPLCDLFKKKYKISESCVYALGSGEFDLTKHVQDSLDNFWTNYEMKSQKEILNSLSGLISDRKDGFQVFFSDVYNNTIAAELKTFCLPYDETAWFGSSTSYFFIFNEQGTIEQVYSGTSIHYN